MAVMLDAAFAGRRIFYVPHTLNLDAPDSFFQRFRFLRSRASNLATRYRTISVRKAFDIIAMRAADGDLLQGGHVDFDSVRKSIRRNVKMITMFREPAARCRSEYEYCRASYGSRSALARIDSSIRYKMAAKYDFDGYLDFLLDRKKDYGDIGARYVGWNGNEKLEHFFGKFVFHAGVTEHGAAFARGLSDKMGLPVALPHWNGGDAAKKTPATAAQRKKIERLYPRDMALYEWQLARV